MHVWEGSSPLGEVSEGLFVHIPHSTNIRDHMAHPALTMMKQLHLRSILVQLLFSVTDIEASDLGCLSFYRAQVEVMRSSSSDRISQVYPDTSGADETNLPRTNDIAIGTMNFFQIIEKNIMFFSLTKSGRDTTDGMLSHMKTWFYLPAPMRDLLWLNVATPR